jgi:tetratricopeptide (TPR) repeat protein
METGLPQDQTTSDKEKTRLQEELKSRTETLGEDFSTLDTMHKLAYLLKCRGEYEEATELLRKAVAILGTQLGADHEQTTYSKGCLAMVLSDATEYEETEIVLRQVLESKERTLGKENAETLRWIERLAWNLFSQGKYNKVRELYPPPPRQTEPGVIVLEMNDTSRLDEIEKIHRGSAALKTRVLGEEHPDTLVSMDKLANWLRGQCKWVEAEISYRRVVAARKKVLEPDDKDTMDSMDGLAGTLSDQGKYSDALEVFQELLGLQEKNYGGEHPKVMKTTGALATVFKELGRLSDAADTLRKLVDVQSSIHGEGHLETLDTASYLAIVVGEQEQYAEAEKIFRQIVELRVKALGKNHAKTLTSLSYLAVMLQKQGRGAEAEAALGGHDEGKDNFFSYQPLSLARSTRIIKVYPSQYKTAALVCELSEEVLNDNHPPCYAAISYTWGSQTADKRIFCHGKKFLVTENVEGILRQFRRPEKMSYLWIDAISINQSSVKERSQQTRIMDDIYRLADVVAVWLGPSTEITADAFGYLEQRSVCGSFSPKLPIFR